MSDTTPQSDNAGDDFLSRALELVRFAVDVSHIHEIAAKYRKAVALDQNDGPLSFEGLLDALEDYSQKLESYCQMVIGFAELAGRDDVILETWRLQEKLARASRLREKE